MIIYTVWGCNKNHVSIKLGSYLSRSAADLAISTLSNENFISIWVEEEWEIEGYQ